jgi:hypothetical protein
MARSCEECLAIRAQVSPPRPRQQVRRIGPPIPSRNQELRELLTYPFPEPVWARLGQTALDEGDPTDIAEAIRKLQWVKAEDLKRREKLHATYPTLYPKPTA